MLALFVPWVAAAASEAFRTTTAVVHHPHAHLYVLQSLGDPAACAYLLVGASRALLIDAPFAGVLALARRATARPIDVALTHGHAHCARAIDEFDRVFVHAADRRLLPPRAAALSDLRENAEFDLGGRVVRAVCLPGHTAGSVGFLDAASGLLFAGDALGGDMHGSRLPLEALLDSARRVDAQGVRAVYRSDDPEPLPPAYVRALRDLVARIVRGEERLPDAPGAAADPGPVVVRAGEVRLVFNPRRIHWL
jgi:glyoxylase-like metal-dependent hydrolase (beta-lactamase superfamily II)